jgi:hypothetical protein
VTPGICARFSSLIWNTCIMALRAFVRGDVGYTLPKPCTYIKSAAACVHHTRSVA